MKKKSKKKIKIVTREEVKKILQISDSTVVNYVKSGMLRMVGKHSIIDATFNYDHICKMLGLKKLPNEPLLTTEQVIPILKISPKYNLGAIRKYCVVHKIPYYAFTNHKGTKTYFLRSEVEKAMAYTIKWGVEFPRYVLNNYVLRETFKTMLNPNLCKSLTNNERNTIEDIILSGKNLSQSSIKNGISYGNSLKSFADGCKKVLFSMKTLDFNLSRLEELAKENVKLKNENNVLHQELNMLTLGKTSVSKQNIDYLSESFSLENLFSIRVFNATKRLGINNIYQLSNFRRSDVQKYQNIGKKTVDTLEELLKDNKMDWKPEDTPWVGRIELAENTVEPSTEKTS